MSSCTINENLAGLRAEIANAEATQNEAVAIMARQEKVPAELWQRLRATSPGVSDEDLQAKVNRQIADSKDVKCLLEAGRLVAGPLREAQREVNDVAAQFDFVGRGYRAIGERIAAALAEVQQARRARSTDLLCEINRLRSAPNKNEIVGRQRRISELKAQRNSAQMSGRETSDGHAFADSLQRVAELRRRVEEAEAAPFEFSSKPRLPPELPPFDLTATVIAIVVDELQKVIPMGQRGDAFGQVSAAFKEANPAECLAECRRIMDGWKEAAKSSDEQEAAAGK